MKRPPMVVLGIVVMLLGLVFMFQGLGYVKGSSMTNFWAVAGPVIALVGAAFLWTGLRGNGGRSGSADDV